MAGLIAGTLGACGAERDRGDTPVRPPITRQLLLLEDEPDFRLPEYDDSAWPAAAIPEEVDVGGVGSIAWYRIHVNGDEPLADLALYLGRMTGAYEVFLNGVPVGSGGKFGAHFAAHYGPTEIVSLRALHPGDNVIAVRVLDLWIGGLAFDPVRIDSAHTLEAERAAQVSKDVLVHGILATLYFGAALAFLGLILSGRRTTTVVGGLVFALCGTQWAVYESYLAEMVGRSPVWEVFDLFSWLVGAFVAAAIPVLHARLVPRRRAMTALTISWVAFLPVAFDPLWAFRSGWWAGIWTVYAILCLGLLVLVVRSRRRVALEPVMVATYLLLAVTGALEPIGEQLGMEPLLKRFLGDGLTIGWLVVLAVVGIRQQAREQSRLRRFGGELEASQSSERTRIARELHDGIGQELQLAHLKIQKLLRESDSDEQLKDVSVQLRRTIESLRNVSRAMPAEDGADLVGRINALAGELTRAGPAIVHLETDAAVDPLSPESCHHLYRIAQQAAMNAIEHGDASEIRMSLSRSKGSVSLTISDDGAGFGDERGRGLGMDSMRERAALLGGTCEVSSSKDGVELQVLVPVEAGPDD